ncbi:MAG: tetratricopeptide repeat protein [Chamaesiphon sp.]|nr:tetratricopeptide repeat protein [Chamaesiphon sp.]
MKQDLLAESEPPDFPVATDDAAAWYQQGNLDRNAGKLDVALACYNKTIELQPHKQEAWTNLGWVLVGLERWNEAVAAYTQAIQLQPGDAEAVANQGWVLF